MKVTHYHRRPDPRMHSVERVFRDVRRALPPEIECRVSVCWCLSRGFWRRLINVVAAAFHQGDVNHITGDVYYLAMLLRKRRTLLTIHDCRLLGRFQGLRWWVYYFFWFWLPEKRSALITVVSQATKDDLLRYLKCAAEKIRVIADPVSDEFRAAPSEFQADKPTILQVGTTENKNILRVAEAIAQLPCRLRIVGCLSGEQVARLTQCRIEFSSVCGLSDEELRREYRNCDMVIFASTFEGFGLPIIEANATGRPVVTSNLSSMPEVAADAACLVDPFSVASIREGVVRVISDPCYREQLIRRGYANAARFRPVPIARQYAEIYEELARKRT